MQTQVASKRRQSPPPEGAPPDLSPFLGITAAAEFADVSSATIRRLLTQRKLRRYKLGGRTLVKREDLLGLIQQV